MFRENNTIKISTIIILLFVFAVGCQEAQAAIFGSTLNGLSSVGLNNGLVGWWTFDGKDMASNVADRTGRGNIGFLNGYVSTTTKAGKIGQALYFDGVNDNVILKDSADFDPGAAFSSCGWFYITNILDDVAVISNTDSANKTSYKWVSGDITSQASIVRGYVRIGGVAYSADYNSGISGFFAGAWHHVCTTFDKSLSSNRLNVYVDGGKYIGTSNAAANNIDAGDYPTIGLMSSAGLFAGNIDDVRLYNRALSTSEIFQLYSQGLSKTGVSAATSRPQTGLDSGGVGQWTFDGKNILNGAMQDISGNGNTAYFSGISSSTFFVNGKMGQAGNFDGVTDKAYIMSPSSFQFDYSTPFSMSFWMKSSQGNSGTRILLSKLTFGSPNKGWYIIANNYSAGTLSFENQDAGSVTNTVTSPTVVFDDKWHLVTATYSGNSNKNGMKIYIDDAAATVGASSAMIQSFNDAAALLTIGGQASTDLYDYPGLMDDINIYNRELTASEIQQLYKQGAGNKIASTAKGLPSTGLNSGLTNWWTFDGKDVLNGRVVDRGSNNFNGSPINIASSTFYVRGKFGQGLNFIKPPTSYIDLGANTPLTSGQAFSISWWEKVIGVGDGYPSRFNFSISGSAKTFLVIRVKSDLNYAPVTFGQASSPSFTFAIGAQSAPTLTSSVGVWRHFVITGSDPVGTLAANFSFYSDGVALTTTNTVGPFGAVATNRIGYDGGDSPTGATLDDVRVYNRQLSAKEVMQLYKMGR